MLAWQLGLCMQYAIYCSDSLIHFLPAAETIIIKSSVIQAISGLCGSMARLLNRTSSPSENAYFSRRISPRPSKVIIPYDEKLPCQMTGEFLYYWVSEWVSNFARYSSAKCTATAPSAAAVTICRSAFVRTSPAAKTPWTLVRVVSSAMM